MVRTIIGTMALLVLTCESDGLPALASDTLDGGAVIAAVPPPPEEGGPRRWSVAVGGVTSLHDAPSASASIIDVLEVGTVLSNLGCQQGEDHIWCSVQPYRGGAKGFAMVGGLRPAKGPDGKVAIGHDDSKSRARQRDFDAHGQVRCAQDLGQTLGLCTAGVARSGGGDAAIVVTFPNGFARTLYFAHGAFIAADATMSGVGRDIDWRTDDDHHIIRVDDQRYELPKALILGD